MALGDPSSPLWSTGVLLKPTGAPRLPLPPHPLSALHLGVTVRHHSTRSCLLQSTGALSHLGTPPPPSHHHSYARSCLLKPTRALRPPRPAHPRSPPHRAPLHPHAWSRSAESAVPPPDFAAHFPLFASRSAMLNMVTLFPFEASLHLDMPLANWSPLSFCALWFMSMPGNLSLFNPFPRYASLQRSQVYSIFAAFQIKAATWAKG
jgi:hypothetical protein